MGLGKLEQMLAALFLAYLHMFFSMQDVSVYNLIVVGFFPLLIHMQMFAPAAVVFNPKCASVCLPRGLKVKERGSKRIQSSNL